MLSYHTCPLATLGGKDTGGMNVYVRELSRQLGSRNIKVDVFTRSQDEHVPHILHDLGYGNRVVHIPAGPEIPIPKQDLEKYLPSFVSGVEEFRDVKDIEYDLIHSHYWLSGLAALSLKKQWNIPVIQMFHTLGLMKQRIARNSEEAEGEYRVNGEREVLNKADRIIAATPAEMAQLQWLYQTDPNKISIIPPGVDLSRFYPIPPEEAKEFIGVPPCGRTLLFVGRIEPLKGLDTLIEAIAIMQQRGGFDENPFCLTVIGGEASTCDDVLTDEMARIQSMCAQYELNNLVTFLGKRSQDTLPYYYSAAEAVVVPSHYESFGMVALEAMACGTPVVASQVGGLAYLVQDGVTGFTVPSVDPHALADRLALLLGDNDLRTEMGRNAVNLAQDFSWQKITDKIEALYSEVVGDFSNS